MADGRSTVFMRWTMTASAPGDPGASGWNLDDVELWAGPTPTASWNNYASAHAAILGERPYLTARDRPVRGRSLFVEVSNPCDTGAPAWMIVGFAESVLPTTLGGTLWLEPLVVLPFQASPEGTLFPLEVPTGALLDYIHFQVVQPNLYVPGDVAFSQGLRLKLADW